MRTILCLILFCLQEEPLSRNGIDAGQLGAAVRAGRGREEPGGADGQAGQEVDRGGGGDYIFC